MLSSSSVFVAAFTAFVATSYGRLDAAFPVKSMWVTHVYVHMASSVGSIVAQWSPAWEDFTFWKSENFYTHSYVYVRVHMCMMKYVKFPHCSYTVLCVLHVSACMHVHTRIYACTTYVRICTYMC